MNQETFQIFLWVMSAVALVVFIALYFVKAGYGMFRTASWGISINNKLAWVLMEAPVFIVMFGLWGKSGAGFAVPVYFFFLLFQLHYLQREDCDGRCQRNWKDDAFKEYFRFDSSSVRQGDAGRLSLHRLFRTGDGAGQYDDLHR